jgi:hypothetical protein
MFPWERPDLPERVLPMMDGRDRRQIAPDRRTSDYDDGMAFRVLSIALSDAALMALPRHVLQPDAQIRRIAFERLTDEFMTGPGAPALVLSPLLTPGFDALDMARILAQCGYRGRYLALVDKLPSANLVRREVAAQSPMINFDVIVLDGSTPIHAL